MSNYDYIVIGAGNAGLASAATLTQAGKKVALFEKHNIPGGFGTTFTRGRFEFEVALHQLNSMNTKDNPGPVRQLFRKWEVEDKIDWIKIDSLYKINLPGGRGVALPSDKDEMCVLLQKEFTQEKDKIKEYLDMVWKFNEEIADFLAQSENSAGEPSAFKKKIMEIGFPKKYPTLQKYAVRSSQDVLDEFFESRELQLCVSAYWCFMGMPLERFPFSILSRCMYLYTIDNPYYLKGGSQMMSQGLCETIRKYGGEIFFNNGIEEIIIENGQAKGVIDEQGNSHYAKHIISNISPIETYAGLCKTEDVTQEARNYLKSYKAGISAFTIFLGLDCAPEDIGFTDSFNLIYDSLNPNEDFKNAYHLDASVDPIIATCYTIDDPTLSDEGTSIITAGVLKYGEAFMQLDPKDYYETKYEIAEQVLDRLETRFPGIKDHIEEMEVATPLTHMRYTHHPGGSIYGYEQDLKSAVFFYPQEEFVSGLHFAGGWVNTCGFGPNYVYGNKVAENLLKEEV
ncbi:MAG TPA: NAD(P)/FAD-dependent oxidoreductase [Candidatus Eisenbacteria bacterium]|nr:NAD(P)/FAD-dependent oxidoreductase [Candidatus Eisenbacteria bacterium]